MALNKICQLVRNSSRLHGDSPVWEQLADKAEAEREVLCRHLDRKALFTGFLRLYAAVHREMNVWETPT
jgi:hypothetical protein